MNVRILSICLGSMLLAAGCGTTDQGDEPTGEFINPSTAEQALAFL